MEQKEIKIDNVAYPQPDTFNHRLETTDGESTTRPISGVLKGSPLFVVEAFEYEAKDLSVSDASNILKAITRRPGKETFQLYYFSPFYGMWRTDEFYVAQNSTRIGCLKEDQETIESISCNMIGVNPVV